MPMIDAVAIDYLKGLMTIKYWAMRMMDQLSIEYCYTITLQANLAQFLKEQFLKDYEHLLPLPKGDIHGVYKAIADTPYALIQRERDHRGALPHQLFFGIGSTWTALHEYAKQENLRRPDGSEPSMAWSAFAAVRHLSEVCNEELSLVPAVSADQTVVVSLYSNYMKWEKELYDDEEDEVLDKLRKALGTPDEAAMWFHPA